MSTQERLPDGDERSQNEAELQLQLGIALFALREISAPEVERAYARATELMIASTPAAEQFPARRSTRPEGAGGGRSRCRMIVVSVEAGEA